MPKRNLPLALDPMESTDGKAVDRKGVRGFANPEELQQIVFDAGRDRFDPLRDWFTALYEVLLGASQGPRFGGFIALYGVDETVALIDDALAGKLTTA